jgi:hypothetical protein
MGLKPVGYLLHRRGIHPELFSDLAHARPARRPQGLLDSFPDPQVKRRAAKALAVPPGPLKAGADSLLDHRPFELGKDAHQSFAGRRVNGASHAEGAMIPVWALASDRQGRHDFKLMHYHAERCLHVTPTMV